MDPNFDDCRLNETSAVIDLAGSDDNRAAALAIARQTRRELIIISRDLDPLVYDNDAFVAAVKDIAINSSRARIRLLVRNLAPVARHGHRLLSMANHLSSFFEVRTPAKQHRDFNEAVMLADRGGIIHRQQADRFTGTVNFNDPLRVSEYTRLFESMWEHADTDPNQQRLQL